MTATEPPRSFAALKTYLAEHKDDLPKRLRQVAEAILLSPDDLAFSTAATAAERMGVQASTLVRFAQALGYQGFSDLQAVFRARIKERLPEYRDRLEAIKGSGPLALFDGFARSSAESFDRARNSLDPAQLNQAVTRLAKAETIYLLGGRRVFPVAAYAVYACAKLGLKAVLIDQLGGMGPEQAIGATERDGLLTVSFSPYATETVVLTSQFKAQGVPVVAITDGAFSPLVPHSDVWLDIAEADFGAFRSLSATFALVMTLLVAAADLRGTTHTT